MTGQAQLLRTAQRVTAVHEEALYSLDDTEPEYSALRAATARRVLMECHLQGTTGGDDRGDPDIRPRPRPCNHLLYRDGSCVGCGAACPVDDRTCLSGVGVVVPLHERRVRDA